MYGAMPYMQLQSFFLVKQPSPSPRAILHSYRSAASAILRLLCEYRRPVICDFMSHVTIMEHV